MTPNGSTKNSTKSNSAGASNQAIGVGREEAATAMRFVSWPKAMLRSTPKDIAAFRMLRAARHGIEIAAPSAADRDHLPQPVLSRLQQRDRAGADARPGPFGAPARLGRQRVLLRAVRGADPGRHVVRPLRRPAHGGGALDPRHGWRLVDRRGSRCLRPDRGARAWSAWAAPPPSCPSCSCARAGFAPARLATALSWVFAASNIGTLAAATPLAWIAATVGWRNGFLGLAAVTVVVAVAFYAFVRDRPPDQPAPPTRRESLGEIVRGLLEVWTTPGLLPVLAMHFFAYATMLTVLGVWGGPYLYDVHKLDGVAARQRAAGHGRGADPGHPGLRAAGPAAALAQEGGAGRRRDLGAAAGRPCPAAAAAARRGGRAAQRLLLLLRLRHGDRGAGPHALSRPPGRPRRHHRQHGAVPGAHRAAGRRRLYRRGVRQFRPCLSRGVRRARDRARAGRLVYVRSRDSATSSPASDMPRGRRAGRPA